MATEEYEAQYNRRIMEFLKDQLDKVRHLSNQKPPDANEKDCRVFDEQIAKGQRLLAKHAKLLDIRQFYTCKVACKAVEKICERLNDILEGWRMRHKVGVEEKLHRQWVMDDERDLHDLLSYILRDVDFDMIEQQRLQWQAIKDTHNDNMGKLQIIDENKVQLHESIGEGGLGVVHRAEWLSAEVAVKKSKRTGELPVEELAELIKEGCVHASLNHPNIVHFHGTTASGWMVMEKADCTLWDLCHGEQKLSWSTMLKLFQQGAAGLNYMHCRKPVLVHSDVKPKNFLIFGTEHNSLKMKVSDFGVAFAQRETSGLSVRLAAGTSKYIAPEAYFEKPLTAESDVFSWGVTLFEVVSGKDPYGGRAGNPEALYFRKSNEYPPCPVESNQDCPSEMLELMKQCCAAEPHDRPTMEEVVCQLGQMSLNWMPQAESTIEGRNVDNACQSIQQPWGLMEAEECVTSSLNLQEQLKYQEAKVGYQRALDLQIARLGEEHELVAESLNRLGLVAGILGNYTEAERLHARALDISRGCLGDEHQYTATCLGYLGVTMRRLGRLSKAEENCTRALMIRTQELGANHPDLAQSLNDLGDVMFDLVKLPKAKECFVKALAIGNDNATTEAARSLFGIGLVMSLQCVFSEAEGHLHRSLEIRKQVLGDFHPHVAQSLCGLANVVISNFVFVGKGDLSQASKFANMALGMTKQIFGPDHPAVARDLFFLGYAMLLQNKLPEAEACHDRALAIFKHAFGDIDRHVASCLMMGAAVKMGQRNISEAVEFCADALTIGIQAFGGDDHLVIGSCLLAMGSSLHQQGKHHEAAQHLSRALAIVQQVLGDNHLLVSTILHDLGEVMYCEEKYPEAKEYHSRALAIRKQALGEDHMNIATILHSLGMVAYEQGRYLEAEENHSRALAIRTQALGEVHEDVAMSLYNLGCAVHQQGKTADAVRLLKKCVAIEKQVLGDDHKNVAFKLRQLEMMKAQQGLGFARLKMMWKFRSTGWIM